MTKIAFIDLDGIVADSTDRFAQATGDNNKVNWSMAFDPSAVALDTLIDGADRDIEVLVDADYEIILLTSRPESMRVATLDWLHEHGIQHQLVMKPPAAQYIKTSVWKASIVDTLAMFLGADVVRFVDDEMINIEEVKKHNDRDRYELATSNNTIC